MNVPVQTKPAIWGIRAWRCRLGNRGEPGRSLDGAAHIARFTGDEPFTFALGGEKREQAIELHFDHLIAFTAPSLEAGTVEHDDLAAAVTNQSGVL